MPRTLVALVVLVFSSVTAAQQPAAQPQSPPQPAAVPPAGAVPPQQMAPAGPPVSPFQVAPEHQAWLEQVLLKWEKDSKTVNNFYCDFQRKTFNIAGPADGGPFAQEDGKLAYHKPDRGSFEIVNSLVWTPKSQAAVPNQLPEQNQPAAAGEYLPRKDVDGNVEPGEHWVCDGKSVYEYRRHDKTLVVNPLPPNMQGQQIVDGPLPFLFGADAAKLKERFWMQPAPDLCRGNFIGIHAKPKLQAGAAEYSDVYVVLRNEQGKPLMPAGLRVVHPNKSWDQYEFKLANAQVNPVIAGWFAELFQEPRTPIGWKRVVQPLQPQVQQAQQPQQPVK